MVYDYSERILEEKKTDVPLRQHLVFGNWVFPFNEHHPDVMYHDILKWNEYYRCNRIYVVLSRKENEDSFQKAKDGVFQCDPVFGYGITHT